MTGRSDEPGGSSISPWSPWRSSWKVKWLIYLPRGLNNICRACKKVQEHLSDFPSFLPCLQSLLLLTCLWHLPGQVIYQTYHHSCLSNHNIGPYIPTCSRVPSLRKVDMGINTYQGVLIFSPSTAHPHLCNQGLCFLFIAPKDDQLFLYLFIP